MGIGLSSYRCFKPANNKTRRRIEKAEQKQREKQIKKNYGVSESEQSNSMWSLYNR